MTARQLVQASLTLKPRTRAWLADQIIASLELEAELRREWCQALGKAKDELRKWEDWEEDEDDEG